MSLTTRPMRLHLRSVLGNPLPGAKVTLQLSAYQADGIEIVPLVWALTEDPLVPGDYIGPIWPNTRTDDGTHYDLLVQASEQKLLTHLVTVTEGETEVILNLKINPPPYPPVYGAQAATNTANTFADAAGTSATIAAQYAAGLGDVSGAVAEAQAAAAQAAAAEEQRLAYEDRIYPGVYSTPPTNKPHSGAPSAEGDRCVILVDGTPYEHLRVGGGWLIPNVDAVALALPSGSSKVGTRQPFSGAKARKQSEKNLDSVDLRDFVTGDGSDETAGMLAALATGARVIRGRDMTVRFEDIELSRGVVFDCENVTFKKLTNTKNLWRIRGGAYIIRHRGVRIDGGYSSSALTYAPDLVVTGIDAPGLKLYFEDCDHDNCGNSSLFTGYFAQGSIYLVNVLNCRSNGQHMPRLPGVINSVFSVNNCRDFRINGWRNTGDGIFINAVDLSSFDRMPACSITADNTTCRFRDVDIEDECGVILYSGCHHSSIAEFNASGCAFGLRMLNARNCSIRQAVIEDSVLQSVYALEWSPYLRLGTGIGSVEEEDVVGFTAENVWIKGSGLGFGAIGAQINGSGAHVVQNARARKIALKNVHILTGGTCLTFQDTDDFEMSGGTLSCSTSATAIINAVQTIANGLGAHVFREVTIDRKGGTGRILNGGLTAGSLQLGTQFYFPGCKYKNLASITSTAIYWRGAGVMHVEGGTVDSQPAGTFLLAFDTGRLVFRDVLGLTYPSTTKISIDYSSVRQVISDHYKRSAYGPSEIVHNTTNWGQVTVPVTTTNFEIGSVMKQNSPIPGGFANVLLTSAGWKGSGAIAS